MKKNPNATAAVVSGAIVTGVQWLLARYARVNLPKYWSDGLTAAVTAAVLFIGRDGVKGALQRVWATAKSVWAGSAAETSTPEAPAA